MKWRNLKYFLDRMTPEELEQEATAIDTYFRREAVIEYLDHVSAPQRKALGLSPEGSSVAVFLREGR